MVNMKNTFSLRFLLGFLAIALLSGFVYAGNLVETPAEIKTAPQITSWTADGQTWYRADISLDTSMYNYGISSFNWRISHPSYLTLVQSQWPSSDFYFEGLALGSLSDPDRTVTTTSIQGSLDLNTPSQAPIGRNGIIASYYFVASPTAPVGQANFDFDYHAIIVRDPSFEQCGDLYCDGSAQTITNDPFTIFRMPGQGYASKLNSIRSQFASVSE